MCLILCARERYYALGVKKLEENLRRRFIVFCGNSLHCVAEVIRKKEGIKCKKMSKGRGEGSEIVVDMSWSNALGDALMAPVISNHQKYAWTAKSEEYEF